MVQPRRTVTALLLILLSVAATHVSGKGADMDMHMNLDAMKNATAPTPTLPLNGVFVDPYDMPSYAGLSSHLGWMLAHVTFMVAAWLFVLPVGVVFSISRSRMALPVQFLFLVLNAAGILSGTIYNVNTPDLYEHNAHHRLGWIAMWIVTAQVIMALVLIHAGRFKKSPASSRGCGVYLPATVDFMAQHNIRQYSDCRWSSSSGQETLNSSRHHSRDLSPTDTLRGDESPSYTREDATRDDDDDDQNGNKLESRNFLRGNLVDKYLSRLVPWRLSRRLLEALDTVYDWVDRTILVLGFIAMLTGGVTYVGLFRANNIFNGLAHFVKGGIFFWYGLLTLGRWMGCFADIGWAWNVKPSQSQVGQWKASLPSAEFIESFVIWLYGTIDVFLEHLAAWGDAWAAQDLEHVSISVMFFGGGLCGMLIESKKAREWLNTSIDLLPASTEVTLSEAKALRALPKTYPIPMNPMPAVIILLLGLMMSAHHQDSMVSTMIHKQWGTLLVGFSLARGVTYILTYLSPPTSVYPNRPPSELVSSFCLISGGLIFMASTKDIVHILEINHLHAMFPFTVIMGFTAFLMAWEITVLALKGWAVRRELQAVSRTKF